MFEGLTNSPSLFPYEVGTYNSSTTTNPSIAMDKNSTCLAGIFYESIGINKVI